jgi:hypothetical protein
VVGSSAQTLTYNAIGNITHKSDVGSYSYGAGNAGPHAVTSAGGQTYAYDANGNNISGDGRTISYTSFDKPSQIIKERIRVRLELNVFQGCCRKKRDITTATVIENREVS